MPKSPTHKTAKLTVFLKALRDESEETGLSREAIDDYLQQERQDWD